MAAGMKTVSHGRDLRRGRYSETGRIYLVTAVTHGREPLFLDFPAARRVVLALRQEQELGRARTLAYVVMPEHIHWLLELGEGTDLSRLVGAVKSVVAHARGGQVWQAGFHDHALRREEDLAAVARYVVANPLRRGMVKRLADYPHWDAIWL